MYTRPKTLPSFGPYCLRSNVAKVKDTQEQERAHDLPRLTNIWLCTYPRSIPDGGLVGPLAINAATQDDALEAFYMILKDEYEESEPDKDLFAIDLLRDVLLLGRIAYKPKICIERKNLRNRLVGLAESDDSVFPSVLEASEEEEERAGDTIDENSDPEIIAAVELLNEEDDEEEGSYMSDITEPNSNSNNKRPTLRTKKAHYATILPGPVSDTDDGDKNNDGQ